MCRSVCFVVPACRLIAGAVIWSSLWLSLVVICCKDWVQELVTNFISICYLVCRHFSYVVVGKLELFFRKKFKINFLQRSLQLYLSAALLFWIANICYSCLISCSDIPFSLLPPFTVRRNFISAGVILIWLQLLQIVIVLWHVPNSNCCADGSHAEWRCCWLCF
jgi:hypothetical protein